MFRGRFVFDYRPQILLLLLLLLLHPSVGSQTSSNSIASTKDETNCTRSCGSLNITRPFRVQGDPQHCGTKEYELSCEENNTIAVLSLYFGKYYVQDINYTSYKIRVVDTDVHKIRANYYSNPRYSLTSFNFTEKDPYSTVKYRYKYLYYPRHVPILFLNCSNQTTSPLLFETAPCINKSRNSSSSSSLSGSTDTYSYFMVISHGYTALNLVESCKITQMIMVSPSTDKSMTSCEDIYTEIGRGFELSWFDYACRLKCGSTYDTYDCRNNLFNDVYIPKCRSALSFGDKIKIAYEFLLFAAGLAIYPILALISVTQLNIKPADNYASGHAYIMACLVVQFQAIKFAFGFPCLIALLIYKWRRRHLSMYDNIEDFLQSNNNLMPIRYSYSNIKKMTKDFKDKLGEGGYGCVYKGQLRSGRLVAIKMLGKSKANGQEFINEVATIGRIHHVNVVQLLGFCVEGSKRALVYDYMPNGSLEKYIFSQQGVISSNELNHEKMFAVALGVARGIEYLHKGCDMQILHFDIKPHNILLDEKFSAKVSDFGLARLCPLDNSIVSLTAARGTLGYIAPELFYKNIGGVSYKADVYSFGMLLMEMAGRRKNLNATIEKSSQIYFPTWVSDQLNDGKDIEIEDTTEEEKKTVQKMIMVALWCIQLKPSERPSMSKVVEMLEGDMEEITMPPKLSLYPPEMPIMDFGECSGTTCASPITESTEIPVLGDTH